MYGKAWRPWALALAAAGLGPLAACIDDEAAMEARVVVDSQPSNPLLLVVSTNFLTTFNPETNQREVTPVVADTFFVSASFDQVYDMSSFRRVYALLRNDEATPEQARMRVFLDGELQYDAADQLADGASLEFTFTSQSDF